ncbi:MAG: GxxExxY protein [Candidatus Pacebacteria bacterium]|nr:GxxExxY protein [Candidatus Paceibacterota bacterium]
MKEAELIYPKLSYQLNGLFFEVQNRLGRYSTERQYSKALEELLKDRDIKYAKEKEIFIPFGDKKIGGNKVDFEIGKILVDVKAKRYITKEDYLQMQRYLQAAKFKLGLIVNFKGKSVVVKRVINFKIN